MSSATSPETLSLIIANTLPPDASPQLNNPLDTIASTVNATFTALGFRLLSTNSTKTTSDPEFLQPLPKQWNQQTGQYAFTYTHDQAPQNTTRYLVTINEDAGVRVSAQIEGSDTAATTHLSPVPTYLGNAFPATPGASALAVRELFLSDEKISEIGDIVHEKIVKAVLPGLKLASEEEILEGKLPAPGREEDVLGKGKGPELLGKGDGVAKGRVGL